MTAIFKEVLFNDGEGAQFEDLNNAQRFLLARLGDGIVSGLAPHLDLAGSPGLENSTHLYAIGDSGAPYESGLGTRVPNFLRGLIATRSTTAEPDGSDAQVLLYHMSPDEPSVARDAAVTNPRWDVVSVALAQANADTQLRDFKDAVTGIVVAQSNLKQRRVTATFTWTQGTENASPVEPSIPAGDVKLAAFRVVPGETLFDPTTDIRDYRMPIGPARIYTSRQWLHNRNANGTSTWRDQPTGILGASPTETAQNFCPVGTSRVVRVGAVASGCNASTFKLGYEDLTDAFVTLATVNDLRGTALAYREYDVLADFGAPLWSNGRMAGYACDRAIATNVSHLCLEFTPHASDTAPSLLQVNWVLAG